MPPHARVRGARHLKLAAVKDDNGLEFAVGGPPPEDEAAPTFPPDDLAVVGKIKVAADVKASAVGFMPTRSPLAEHKTSLGAALLNPSGGKGSVKFAKAPTAAAADSKGVLNK